MSIPLSGAAIALRHHRARADAIAVIVVLKAPITAMAATKKPMVSILNVRHPDAIADEKSGTAAPSNAALGFLVYNVHPAQVLATKTESDLIACAPRRQTKSTRRCCWRCKPISRSLNVHPAQVFLGDSGSLTIGFLVAAIAVIGAFKTTILTVVLLPVFVVVRCRWPTWRWRSRGACSRRQSPFAPDRGHFHHRLLDAGWTQREVVFLVLRYHAGDRACQHHRDRGEKDITRRR